jgi:hypothetical protein
VTTAPGRPAATARGRAALPPIRATYGVMLVAVPGVVIHLATGQPPGRRACRIARLLGARHLVQAAVSALAPMPGVLAAGAGVDVLHTASMLMLAAVDRRARRVALTDAVAESLFAAAGFSSAGGPG